MASRTPLIIQAFQHAFDETMSVGVEARDLHDEKSPMLKTAWSLYIHRLDIFVNLYNKAHQYQVSRNWKAKELCLGSKRAVVAFQLSLTRKKLFEPDVS